jgi:phage-related protein
MYVAAWRFIISKGLNVLESLPGLALEAGRRVVGALMDGLRAAAPGVADAIEKVVDVIASFLPWSNAERGPLSSIMSVGGNIVGAIAGGLKGATDLAAGAASAVAGAITDALGSAVDKAKSIGKSVADGAASAVSGGVDKLKKSGKALTGTVAEGAKSAGGAVKDAVSGAAEKAGSVLPMSNADEGPFSNLIERGQKLVGTVAKGVQDEGSTLQQTLSGVAEGTPFGAAAESIVGAIGGAGPAGGSGRGAAGGDSNRPIEIVLEQTNNFEGTGSREDVRERIREATRNGGQDALVELEMLLQQTLSEG